MTSRVAPRIAPTLILITDRAWSIERVERVIADVGRALRPGVLAVQLRDKSAPQSVLAQHARSLRDATSRVGAALYVNAPTQAALRIALDVGADGVHVPCRPEVIATARELCGPSPWITSPAHTDEEVGAAVQAGVDGVLVSPIFDTPGKGPPRGTGAIATARACAAGRAVWALGGVDPTRAEACAVAGADGVAVIRALLDATDPVAVATVFDAAFRGSSLLPLPPMADRPGNV